MFDLKGKVALLTGATAWLGCDMAEAFAEQGCDIILTSPKRKRPIRPRRKSPPSTALRPLVCRWMSTT